MSELEVRMGKLKDALALHVPARVVTRDAEDPAQQKAADMEKGIYTILSLNEQGFTNVAGYNAKDARQGILLVGDFELADKNAKGSAVEAEEFKMRDEIVAFCGALPADLCLLSLTGFQQSGQVFKPRGWAIFTLEYQP